MRRCPNPKCKSNHTVKAGSKVSVSKGRRPRGQCMECGVTFYAEETTGKRGGKG